MTRRRFQSSRKRLEKGAGFLSALAARRWLVLVDDDGFSASHAELGLEVRQVCDVLLYRDCTTAELAARLGAGANVHRVEGARLLPQHFHLPLTPEGDGVFGLYCLRRALDSTSLWPGGQSVGEWFAAFLFWTGRSSKGHE